eukprot:GHVH01016318.1.p2 GENE.GHVH01016318.1~~GHVH01016318.1.p2  ORF type:complete len:163 (-),score=11.00 GHVH01016318.1:419-907(-)
MTSTVMSKRTLILLQKKHIRKCVCCEAGGRSALQCNALPDSVHVTWDNNREICVVDIDGRLRTPFTTSHPPSVEKWNRDSRFSLYDTKYPGVGLNLDEFIQLETTIAHDGVSDDVTLEKFILESQVNGITSFHHFLCSINCSGSMIATENYSQVLCCAHLSG